MDMKGKTIYVRMLGGFSIHYGRKVISLNRVRSSKSVRLLQMLLLSVPDGISKNELIDNLYLWNGGTDSPDYNNNLNEMWVHSPPLGAQANFNRIEKHDTM